MLDAVVVGAGPNGLTAAVELARRGFAVELFEAGETVGGGARTEELTLPGFRHDPCSAVHPLAVGSPAFRAMPLARHGLEWLQPQLSLAHPFQDGTAAVLTRSVGESAMSLGPQDAGAYRRLVSPFTGHWGTLAEDFLRTPWDGLPRDPYRWARFGLDAIQPAALPSRRSCASRAAPSARASRSSASTNSRPPAPTSSTPRPRRSPGSRVSAARTTTTATAPPASRSITPSRAPCPGPPRRPGGPGPSTSAPRPPRSTRPCARPWPGATRVSRS